MTAYRDPFTLEEAMRELRHLRRRVKVLEAELASGEPVALVTSADNGEVDIAEIDMRLSKLKRGTKLYASKDQA